MTTQAVTIQQKLAGKASFSSFVGAVQSVSTTGFVVVVNGQIVNALPGSAYLPAVAEPVVVWFINKVAYLMGPATPNPGQGTVVSAAGGLVTLSTTRGNITAPYAASVTPTAGQVMQITWANGPFAIAVLSTSPAGGTAPSGGSSGAVSHTTKFTAIDSGSYQSRWWTGLVYASDSNVGAWFYGSKIADTIPASASISSIQIYLPVNSTNGVAANFATHTSQTKPGGAPAFGSTAAVGVASGWVTLPNSFAAALKAGGGAAGVGVVHGGYSIFNSYGADGQSGALLITATY